MTPCLDCGVACAGPRCPTHQRQQRAKYSSPHQTLRTLWEPVVAQGHVYCSRYGTDPNCPGLITDGTFDLDHIDGEELPAHPPCNRRAHQLDTGRGVAISTAPD